MRLEQIETEQAKLTQAQIDEKLGQTVANVAKTVGRGAVQGGKAVANLAVKGAKAGVWGATNLAQNAMQQRAAQGSRLAGGKSQSKFQQATQRIGAGQGITGMLSQELAPHIKGLQAVLSDPMTRAKWKQLVAQAAKRVK